MINTSKNKRKVQTKQFKNLEAALTWLQNQYNLDSKKPWISIASSGNGCEVKLTTNNIKGR